MPAFITDKSGGQVFEQTFKENNSASICELIRNAKTFLLLLGCNKALTQATHNFTLRTPKQVLTSGLNGLE